MTIFTALAIIALCTTTLILAAAYSMYRLFLYVRDIDKARTREEKAEEFMANINDIYESFNASA